MELVFSRGASYITSNNKINPDNLVNSEMSLYMGHLIKSKVIRYFNGTKPKLVLDEALSRIDFSAFCRTPLNNDEKLLLRDLIVYNLFLYDIEPDPIDFDEILSRL